LARLIERRLITRKPYRIHSIGNGTQITNIETSNPSNSFHVRRAM
jgi:hypothetical protein